MNRIFTFNEATFDGQSIAAIFTNKTAHDKPFRLTISFKYYAESYHFYYTTENEQLSQYNYFISVWRKSLAE